MDNEKYKLERSFIIVGLKLEKEKTKRNIIMVVLFSILCGIVIYAISGGFNTLTDFLCFIIMSIFFGSISYFLSISAFAAVTDSFTNITNLEERKKHLEEKLKYDFQAKDILGNKNIVTNFDKNKIKNYAKGNLTDKDYETILMCIKFSINLYKNEIENYDDELTIAEKSLELEKLKSFNKTLDVFTTRSKPSPSEKTLALNCVYTYFDMMIDIKRFDENISDERKTELLQKIGALDSVIFKLEL